MSAFSGAQGPGAMRTRRAQKRAEAEARNAATPAERRRAHRMPCPTQKHKYASEHEAAVELVGTIVARNRGRNQRRECRSFIPVRTLQPLAPHVFTTAKEGHTVMTRRILAALIVAAVATLTGLVVASAPAQAAPERAASTASVATGRCWVSPDQYARLSVTRYAVTGGIQYHMDENSSTPVLGMKYYQKQIKLAGVALPGTNDQYKNFVGTQTRDVVGYWTTSTGVTVSCRVTI